jgi:hypothetical protein
MIVAIYMKICLPFLSKDKLISQIRYTDLIIVDGNPLEDPESNLRLIMKDDKIYENTL